MKRQKKKDSFTGPMILEMQNKYNKYWSDFSLIFAIAVVLDPRYKMKIVEYAFQKIHGINSVGQLENVVGALYNLYHEYETQVANELVSMNVVASSLESEEDDMMQVFFFMFDFIFLS
jgi:Domain of unknown function (DUF4413)